MLKIENYSIVLLSLFEFCCCFLLESPELCEILSPMNGFLFETTLFVGVAYICSWIASELLLLMLIFKRFDIYSSQVVYL